MHRIQLLLVLAAALVVSALTGCLFNPSEGGDVEPAEYSEALTHPDSLLNDLQTSYQRREIERYATLLSHRFVFKFQAGPDADEFPDGLTFEQDSLFTNNMFRSSDVVEIRLSMTWGPPSDQIWVGEPAQRVILSDLNLDVEKTGDLILRVSGDEQQYYFQPGVAEDFEDPERLYIRAWQDIGSTSAPRPPLAERLNPLSDDDEIFEDGMRVVHVSMSELVRLMGQDEFAEAFAGSRVRVN